MIKFLDIYKQDKKLINSLINDFKKIIRNSDFILGENVSKFEKKFSKFCGTKYAVGCANGTDALFLALKSLDLPKNSEVLVPAMTWCSTVFAVVHAGLKPVLVDTEKNGSVICVDSLKKTISKKTKAIIAVHLYGNICNMDEIKKIMKKYNKKIYLIEDSAQAHGLKYSRNKKAGSLGDLGCFSFYPGKNLGAYGDAGAITTNNKKFFLKLKQLRNMGSLTKHEHKFIGFNSRLDTIQATVLLKKINFLNKLNKKRKIIADIYKKNIDNKYIYNLKYCKTSVFHQYVILTKKRKKLIHILRKNKISYGIHYPRAIHQLNAFKKYFKKKFKNAEELASNSISLPIDPNLSKNNVLKICKVVNRLN